MFLVSLHLLAFDDAIIEVQKIYQSSLRSFQMGATGLVFIAVGLGCAKALVKMARPNEAVIFQTDIGPMVVSVKTLVNVSIKIAKKFSFVKTAKAKVQIHDKKVELKLGLVLWEVGGQPATLLSEVQEAVLERISRLLGRKNHLTIVCYINGIDQMQESNTDSGE